ncbi:hypothetical protein AAVH_24231 [Aphelenchoides avenae]|nr:hypothetical protein AAVH_24231 [Aphelenchus avenae]
MSSNDLPLSSAVATIEQMQVPAEQMQIDGIQGLPLAAQTLVPENNMLEAPMFHLPASLAEQPNYTSVFAPLQTMQATVEAVTLQSPESHSTSIKVCGGLLESYDYVGPDSDNYKDVMQHMNEAAKECKQAEIKTKRRWSRSSPRTTWSYRSIGAS